MSDFMKTEWAPQEGMVPAFSIQNPPAKAIMLGVKTMELRKWKTKDKGWLVIHTGKLWYGDITPEVGKRVDAEKWDALKRYIHRLELPTEVTQYHFQALIGMARLVRCAPFLSEVRYIGCESYHRSDARWERDDIGWLFEEVIEFDQPILQQRGYPGIFPVELALLPEEAQEIFRGVKQNVG